MSSARFEAKAASRCASISDLNNWSSAVGSGDNWSVLRNLRVAPVADARRGVIGPSNALVSCCGTDGAFPGCESKAFSGGLAPAAMDWSGWLVLYRMCGLFDLGAMGVCLWL